MRSLTQSIHARVAGLMLLALGALALAVTESASVARFDVETSRAVHETSAPPVTDWTGTITTFGGTEKVVLISLVAIAVLAAIRHWHGILALALAVAATQLTVHLAKLLVSRPRPDQSYALAEAGGFSFPSGHAALAMAAYATLTLIVARACGGALRLALVLAGALVVVAVGASRVYLGVHYPTDVFAGWLMGAILVVASWAIATRLGALMPRARAPRAA